MASTYEERYERALAAAKKSVDEAADICFSTDDWEKAIGGAVEVAIEEKAFRTPRTP